MKATFAAVAALVLLAACDRQPVAGTSADSAPVDAINRAAVVRPAPPSAKNAALALMKERHEQMERIRDAMKVIGLQLKTSSPNLAAIRTSASTIEKLAPRIPSWFPAGTGPDVGKTDAKAAIWEKPDDFAAKSREFTAKARAFNAAAKSGNLAAIRAAVGPMGKSCKACHDPYREED